MTNMAVRQIEFYFTVENLCRDIFMRSYMDEEVRMKTMCSKIMCPSLENMLTPLCLCGCPLSSLAPEMGKQHGSGQVR